MQRRLNVKKRRKFNERRLVLKFAKDASSNAKRTSKALEIPYHIIKDGVIYDVYDNNTTMTSNLKKTNSNKSDLIKGSKICLK